MRKWKTVALVALAAISFLSPMIEQMVTGRVDMLSHFSVAATVVELILLFWWFHLDKADQNYQAGKLLNAGVLVLAAVALPIYFILSRGWRRGATAIAVALVFLAATFVLADLGERLGVMLTS